MFALLPNLLASLRFHPRTRAELALDWPDCPLAKGNAPVKALGNP